MKGYTITVPGSDVSEAGADNLLASHAKHGCEFVLTTFRATVPAEVDATLRDEGLRWTWPWDEPDVCPLSGLKRHVYTTRDRAARIACFLSHYRLWTLCAETDEPLLVFEDDATLVARFDPSMLPEGWGAIGLNDPRGATWCAGRFHTQLQHHTAEVVRVPWVHADKTIPQGLAGGSAYALWPGCARRLIEMARKLGAWPNDAILCRQLFPDLGTVRRYYTRVSRRESQLA